MSAGGTSPIAPTDALAPLGPRSLTVLFDLSNQCNLRCRMCHFSFDGVFHARARYPSPAQFERAARMLLPLARTVYLSASSEPLTSPHFTEILRIAAGYEPPELRMLTNGLLLEPQTAEALIERGLTHLHVSIEGATPGTYARIRRGGRLETLRQNLLQLKELKRRRGVRHPLVQFNVVLMRSNLEELELLVDLAVELGVEQFACRHLMPFEGLGMEHESTTLDKPRANERFRGFLERATARGVAVTSFPDFYQLDGRRWDPPADPRASALPPEARAPFGSVDAPVEPCVTADDSVELAGWALSLGGIERVEVWREGPARGDAAGSDRTGLTLVGTTRTVNGSRPDVSAEHPGVPESYRAGWSISVSRSQLGLAPGVPVRLHVVAVERGGVRGELGVREVTFASGGRATRHLLCRKPFDSVYVDVYGEVHPYPDCQSVLSFGSVAHAEGFEAIWFGPAFRELREQIVRDEPPDMCRGCGNLINRNVDDDGFFHERAVELPATFGAIDTPDQPVMAMGAAFDFTGWALTRSGPTRTFASRIGPDGAVPVGTPRADRRQRKDLAARFGAVPDAARAGWRVRIRRGEFPGGASALIALYAQAPSGDAELLGYRRLGFAP